MYITDQIKNNAKMHIYNIATHSETKEQYIVFGIGNHMYVLENSKFNELLLSNNYYEKVLSYDLDVIINGSYQQDEEFDGIGAEYFVDRILPDYNQDLSKEQMSAFVLYRIPGYKDVIITPQDVFLSQGTNGPRFTFIGFKFKTKF